MDRKRPLDFQFDNTSFNRRQSVNHLNNVKNNYLEDLSKQPRAVLLSKLNNLEIPFKKSFNRVELAKLIIDYEVKNEIHSSSPITPTQSQKGLGFGKWYLRHEDYTKSIFKPYYKSSKAQVVKFRHVLSPEMMNVVSNILSNKRVNISKLKEEELKYLHEINHMSGAGLNLGKRMFIKPVSSVRQPVPLKEKLEVDLAERDIGHNDSPILRREIRNLTRLEKLKLRR